MEISARGLSISRCYRTLADGLYDQTSGLNLCVLIVQKAREVRVELQLYVVIPVSFPLNVMDGSGYSDTPLNHFEPLGVVNMLPKRCIATVGSKVLGRSLEGGWHAARLSCLRLCNMACLGRLTRPVNAQRQN